MAQMQDDQYCSFKKYSPQYSKYEIMYNNINDNRKKEIWKTENVKINQNIIPASSNKEYLHVSLRKNNEIIRKKSQQM